MQEIYKDYLFEKHILVSEGNFEEKNIFETLFALAHFFGVRIIKGEKLVNHGMIEELSKRFGENVPEPFYKGFPVSVRELTTEQLLFDQLLHYFVTYGMGDFDEPGHSVFEKDFERAAFQEDAKVRGFVVQTEEEAEETIKNLVFCDNVFSGINFDKCFCKAGYMLRDEDDSGKIYEPKTAESAFLVDCESTFAYLFGIDLLKNEFIWLNQARNSNVQVAGNTPLAFLLDYFRVTEIFNVYDFFEMMAEEMVEDPLDAEIVVTDHETVCADGAEILREYDFERIRAFMG